MHQLVVMRLTTMQVDLRTPVRVSVGTEHISDIIADFEQALG